MYILLSFYVLFLCVISCNNKAITVCLLLVYLLTIKHLYHCMGLSNSSFYSVYKCNKIFVFLQNLHRFVAYHTPKIGLSVRVKIKKGDTKHV